MQNPQKVSKNAPCAHHTPKKRPQFQRFSAKRPWHGTSGAFFSPQFQRFSAKRPWHGTRGAFFSPQSTRITPQKHPRRVLQPAISPHPDTGGTILPTRDTRGAFLSQRLTSIRPAAHSSPRNSPASGPLSRNPQTASAPSNTFSPSLLYLPTCVTVIFLPSRAALPSPSSVSAAEPASASANTSTSSRLPSGAGCATSTSSSSCR